MYAITLQECDHKDEWAAAIASLLDPTSTPAVKKKKNVFKRVGKLLKRSFGARCMVAAELAAMLTPSAVCSAKEEEEAVHGWTPCQCCQANIQCTVDAGVPVADPG